MTKLNIMLTVLLFSGSISVYAIEDAGFDEICKIYTEAKNSNMPKRQLSDYIFDNIKNRVSSKDALDAHAAVFNLGVDKRFAIFKEIVESSLNHKWECAAVKELMR